MQAPSQGVYLLRCWQDVFGDGKEGNSQGGEM